MTKELEKLMQKYAHARLSKKHFKDADSMINHIEMFLDGKEQNIKRKYHNVLSQLRLDRKMPDSTKTNVKEAAELDFLASSEFLASLKLKLSEAVHEIEQMKAIHLSEVY